MSYTKWVFFTYLLISAPAIAAVTNAGPAINAQISAAASAGGGGYVVLPSGTYMIDAVNTPISMKSNVYLVLSPGAVLQAITNSAASYAIVRAFGVSNAGIYGGAIVGDRTTHTGTTGEWGMGIDLEAVTNFVVSSVNISNCWGDGIYISDNNNSSTPSSGVWISGVVSTNNRRQGLSGINWIGGSISGSTFSNTHGTAPEGGIDLEPNLSTQQVSGISISGNNISNNAGAGIYLVPYTGTNLVLNNTMSGNRRGMYISSSSNNTIMNNNITSNQVGGIAILVGSNYNTVNFNAFSNNNTANLQTPDISIDGNKNIIFKNRFTTDFAGIIIAKSSISNYILGNMFSGSFQAGTISNEGTGTVIVNSF